MTDIRIDTEVSIKVFWLTKNKSLKQKLLRKQYEKEIQEVELKAREYIQDLLTELLKD